MTRPQSPTYYSVIPTAVEGSPSLSFRAFREISQKSNIDLWTKAPRSTSSPITQKYNVSKLVYFESLPTMSDAILREKQLKKWSRLKKDRLIESKNPNYADLYDNI